jgi:basic amino acid/polyamine antiporter, APA family
MSRLRLSDAILLVAGNTIGAGIFLAPNLVARQLPSDVWMLAAWLFAGVLTLFGALAIAELGGMMPSNGGLYRYLTEAYSPLVGFLSGWSTFLILYSGALAWVAVGFSMTLGYFVPLSPWSSRAVSVTVLAFFAAVNVTGLRPGAVAQDLLTVLKAGGLLAIVAAAVLSPPHAPSPSVAVTVPAFGVALIACLVTYDGWVTLSFVTGDLENPQRNIPRALAGGMGMVILLYLLANIAYVRLLTPGQMAASNRVGADAAERAFGPAGGGVVAVVMLLSMAGCVNGLLLATPRLYQAMAQDGLFFRQLAATHPRFGTPAIAISVKAAWAMLLVVTGSYETLGAYAMPAAYIFYGLAAFAVIVLRVKRPHAPRPYRMWGYPFTPLAFALVAFGFVLNTLRETPGPALAGLVLILTGIPAYLFWRRRSTEVIHAR